MSGASQKSSARPEGFGALTRLPLFFALAGKRAVVAGGASAAAWKAELLAAAGATVAVYAADVSDDMLQVADFSAGGRIIVHRREWSEPDLHGATLAVGDGADGDRAAAFSRAARAAGVPVNIIDKPEFCDFSFGAIVNRSPLVIGISTDGAAPAFAQEIRGKLEAILPHGFARWAAVAARWRSAVKACGLSFAGRRKFWRLFAAHAMEHADDGPRQGDFDRFVGAVAGESGGEDGSVTIVDVERNDPESLTLRAIRALQSADVIVFDRHASAQVLDFARREARKIRVVRTDYEDFGDRELDALSADLVKQGQHVVIVATHDGDGLVPPQRTCASAVFDFAQ